MPFYPTSGMVRGPSSALWLLFDQATRYIRRIALAAAGGFGNRCIGPRRRNAAKAASSFDACHKQQVYFWLYTTAKLSNISVRK
jgi:hypothetical protein